MVRSSGPEEKRSLASDAEESEADDASRRRSVELQSPPPDNPDPTTAIASFARHDISPTRRRTDDVDTPSDVDMQASSPEPAADDGRQLAGGGVGPTVGTSPPPLPSPPPVSAAAAGVADVDDDDATASLVITDVAKYVSGPDSA